MSKPVGGRGIKAPYETTHVRVPVPIKGKVQALIDEFRDSYTRQSEKSLVRLDEVESEGSENLHSALEVIEFQAEVIDYCNLKVQALSQELEFQTEELEFQKASIRFQSEEIQSQGQRIESQDQELQLQDQELQSRNPLTGYQTNRKNNLLTSLEDAKKEAIKQLRSKKGKYFEVAELLSFIYGVKVTKEDLEA